MKADNKRDYLVNEDIIIPEVETWPTIATIIIFAIIAYMALFEL